MRLSTLRDLEELSGISGRRLMDLARRAGTYYRPFDLRRTGSAKWRHIDNPTDELKTVQRRLDLKVLRQLPLRPEMFGGVPGRSARDAAALHLAKECVAILDLREFFPSTSHGRVYRTFRALGWDARAARILTQLTTFQQRLPQGAPTSVTLGNLVLEPLCKDLAALCEARALRVSLYVDDVTISGSGDAVRAAIEPIIRLIRQHGYAVRHSKVRIMPSGGRQEVLGTGVNRGRLSVGRRRIEALRGGLLEEQNSLQLPARLAGGMAHVRSVSAIQGLSLERLARQIWESSTPGRDGRRRVKGETRPCSTARRHCTHRGTAERSTSVPRHPGAPLGGLPPS